MLAARIHAVKNQQTGPGREVDPSDSSPQCGQELVDPLVNTRDLVDPLVNTRELVDPLVNTPPSERVFKAARFHTDNSRDVGLYGPTFLLVRMDLKRVPACG